MILKDERITLVDGGKVITEEKDLVKKFKDSFEKILVTLKIDRPILSNLSDDPVLNAIENFSHHASVLKIKEARDSSDCFSFKLNLNNTIEIILNSNLNNTIQTSAFPGQLKYADMKPVFKKDSRTDKKNYRPISILSNVSKIYERCLNKQLEEYFQALLCKYQCGFRKGYSVINALLPMIEKWRESLDKGGAFRALLNDLSKDFDR